MYDEYYQDEMGYDPEDINMNYLNNVNNQNNLNFNSNNNYSNIFNQNFTMKSNNISNMPQIEKQNQKMPSQMKMKDFRLEKNILYISDLPYNTNETDIKLFFQRYGDAVSRITILGRRFSNDTRPINAKVVFKDSQTANKARLEMNLRKLKGHAIRLMWEEYDNNIRYNSSTNLFVKGIPFNVQPREFYEFFMKFGDISSAKLNENEQGNHLGYGYVTYYNPESAEAAINSCNGKVVWKSLLQVDYFKKKNERISTSGPEVYKIYITNLPGDFNEQDIINLTKEYGSIIDCAIKVEKIGRRYALVCYNSEEAAIKAKQNLNKKNIRGYNLYCYIMDDKSPVEPNNNYNNKNKIADSQKNQRFFQRAIPGFRNNNNLCNLYIKNIPYTIKEKEFNEIFEKYGKIVSSKLEMYNLVTNIGGKQVETPTSKGVGYVCYEDPNVAKDVKEKLNNQYIPGYEHWKDPLTIEYFVSKSQREIMNNQNNSYEMQLKNPAPMAMPINQFNDINDNNDNNTQRFNSQEFENLPDIEAKKEYLGDIIYWQVIGNNMVKDLPNVEKNTSKITGMILGIDNMDEIIKICNNNELLNSNISEALQLLKANNYDFNS